MGRKEIRTASRLSDRPFGRLSEEEASLAALAQEPLRNLTRLSPFGFIHPTKAWRTCSKKVLALVKNPVREHGASSMEKAIYIGRLTANGRRWSANGRRWSAPGRRWSANGRRWSAPKPPSPFIPARERGGILAFSRHPPVGHSRELR